MGEQLDIKKRHRRVKLVFNPFSGAAKDSPELLAELIIRLQSWKLTPDVSLLEPDSDIPSLVADAKAKGISMFVACGGDGTVSAVSKAIAGLPAILGIIPAGMQNNIALSLGIPRGITEAAAILRNGRRVKIDLGTLSCRGSEILFTEVCTVGLTSAVFDSADQIQHGRIGKLGDFLSSFISSAPSEIRLLIDGKHRLVSTGHVIVVSNMPYTGRNFRIGGPQAYNDGLLDVLFPGDVPKLKLLDIAFRKHAVHELYGPGIQSFQARSIDIETVPPMHVMADGVVLGEGPVSIGIRRRAVGVMVPAPERREVKRRGLSAGT